MHMQHYENVQQKKFLKRKSYKRKYLGDDHLFNDEEKRQS